LNCGLWVSRAIECGDGRVMILRESEYPVSWVFAMKEGAKELEQGIVRSEGDLEGVVAKDNELRKVKMLLEGIGVEESVISAVKWERLVKKAVEKYFMAGGRL
jgi:hypothetical protein